MKKMSEFEKKYALFAPYVTDEATRDNMLHNEDLLNKYNNHLEEIEELIREIASRFDIETVFNLLKETVFKYPENVLESFMKAYKSSSEASKNNSEVVKFYNKTLHLGDECVRYIEDHGIITNRGYRDIPEKVLDEKYENINTEDITFKNEKLDEIYATLNLVEKRLLINLLNNDGLTLLGNLFASVNVRLRYLLDILIAKGIGIEILNPELAKVYGEYELLCLLYAIFELQYPDIVIANVRYFIMNNRLSVLKVIVLGGALGTLNNYNIDTLRAMSDKDIFEDIMKKGYNLTKRDE